MGSLVRGAQSRRRDMGIDLCRRQALVAQQLLNDPQVGAPVEQMRGEAVAKRVRRDAEREAGPRPQPIESEPDPPHSQRAPSMVDEDLGRNGGRSGAATRSRATGEERGATGREVCLDRQPGWPSEESDPLLAALAD